MGIKIGYDLFAGASAAGTASGVTGNLQVETAVAGKHKVRIQRGDDDDYWNATTGAFDNGATSEANELTFPGSEQADGRGPAIRRLSTKLPEAMLALSAGQLLTINVYPTGGTPGEAITTATIKLIVK